MQIPNCFDIILYTGDLTNIHSVKTPNLTNHGQKQAANISERDRQALTFSSNFGAAICECVCGTLLLVEVGN